MFFENILLNGMLIFLDAHFMALFFLFVAHCHYGMEDSEVCKEDQLCLHAGGEKKR